MTAARKENETFEEYKQRQKDDTKALKALKHGTMFWNPMFDGTYMNKEKQAKKAAKKKGTK